MPNIYAIDKEKGWNVRNDGWHDCIREWWNIDAFVKGEKNYSITASFEYEKETPAANLFFTLFDWDENKTYDLGSYEDDISTIKCNSRYEVNISYKSSWMKGRYPKYIVHLENEGVIVELELQAVSKPKFVLEDEGGILPIGFGYYKYLFIPKCRVKGWIKFNGIFEKVEGAGYFEHVWGNWSYNNPLKGGAILHYFRLFDWWIKNKNISMNSITVASNNPFGYDWCWASFSNGWALFYGAIPFWVEEMKFGIAYLCDGEKIMELGKIYYEYLDGIFCEGTYIPTKIKLVAEGNEKLVLIMKMDKKPHLYKDYLNSFYWEKLILYECPGKIKGYFINDEKIDLDGYCEIEIERQISIFKYLLFKLNPLQNGLQILFISYLLNIILTLEFHLKPFFIDFDIRTISYLNLPVSRLRKGDIGKANTSL